MSRPYRRRPRESASPGGVTVAGDGPGHRGHLSTSLGGDVSRYLGKTTALVAAAAVLVATLAAGTGSATGRSGTDRVRYILPPGDYGGLPTNTNSRDQLPLYDGLTPLRGNVTDADINSHFLPEDFTPIGATHEELTGRAGTTIIYDSYGVPHIHGDTKEDLAFGAGWATARDRGLLIELGRGPARVAVADVPGIDAFSLVTSGQSFVPSAATEKLVSDQQKLLVATYGAKGQEILDEAQAEADGINAYWAANHIAQAPATVDDVIAVTAFIGSIFGAGGGGEARNSELLDELQHQLGPARGRQGVERRHALERSGGADHHPRSASTIPRSPAAPSGVRSPSTPARSSRSIPACPAATPRWRATPPVPRPSTPPPPRPRPSPHRPAT